jgi:MFS transporter, DHA2 family, multidrug resistance protein
MSAEGLSGVLNPRIVAEGDLFDAGIRQELARLSGFDRWMIVIGLALASALELGTQIAVNLILIDMKGNIAASQDELSWIVIAYGAAFLSVVPLTPWFVRRLGNRNYLVMSLLVYGGGAFACFLSRTLPELLAARTVMGLGGGAFLVRALVAMNRLFLPREKVAAFAVFGLVIHSSRALMPVLFGVVTDRGRWNLAFLALVPLTLLAAALLYAFIPRHLEFEPEPPSVDFVAVGLIVAGLSAFQVVLSRGQQDMWLESPFIRSMLLLSAVCLAAFAWRDTRRDNDNPVLNLRLLSREPALFSGLGLALIFGALFGGSLYLLPQYLRGIQGYDATQASVFFSVDAIGTYAGLVFGVKFAPKLSPPVVALMGLAMFAVAYHLLTLRLTPDTPALDLFLILVLHGVSLGMTMPGVSGILMATSAARYFAYDNAIYLLFRNLGSALGVSAAVVLLNVRETFHSSRLLDVANRLSAPVDRVLAQLGQVLQGKGLAPDMAQLGSYQIFQGVVMTQTSVLSIMDVFWAFEWLAIAGIVLVLATWRRARPAAPASAPLGATATDGLRGISPALLHP